MPTVNEVISQTDNAVKSLSTQDPAGIAIQVMTPAIQAFSQDPAGFNQIVLYVIHKYYPAADPSGDASKPRYYLDDLYRRTADDHNSSSLITDLKAWQDYVHSKSGYEVDPAQPGKKIVVSSPTGTLSTTDKPDTSIAGQIKGAVDSLNPLSGIEAIGSFFNTLASGQTWLRAGKVVIGAFLVVLGLYLMANSSRTFKSALGTAKKAATLAAL